MSNDPKADIIDAIITLDSYDRGYGSAIVSANGGLGDASGTQIGNYSILDTKGDGQAKNAGFYGIAYKDDATGQTVIAYRGTGNNADLNSNRDGSDLVHGSGNDNSRAAFFLRGSRRLAA